MNLFATKPLDLLISEAQQSGEHSLKRTLGPFQLTALGVGAVIGAGILVYIASSGPKPTAPVAHAVITTKAADENVGEKQPVATGAHIGVGSKGT